MKTAITLVYIFLIASLLAGCSLLAPAVTTDPNPLYTQAAQTIEATLTYGAVQSTILAEVNKTVEPSVTPTVQPSDTVMPTIAETIAPTVGFSTTLTNSMVSATTNTNCREYPSSTGNYQSALLVGQKVELRGRLADNSWWYIEDPEESSKSCWVWNDTTVVEGDPTVALVISVPRTPIPSYSISGSVSPSSYSGVCPVTITVHGKIKATAGSYNDLTYSWATNFGVSPGSGVAEFPAAGTKSFSASFVISADTSGWVKFKVDGPVSLTTGKLNMTVDCD